MSLYKILLFICFVTVTNFGVTQEEVVSKAREVHLQRSSILVSNLEASLKVYRDILGFEVGMIAKSDKDSYAYPVFNIPKEANIRMATLHSTDQKRIINLKEVTGIELPKPTSEPYMSAVLIRVDDIEFIQQKTKELGLKQVKMHTVKGARISYKEMAFLDPDGHLVAVYQLL